MKTILRTIPIFLVLMILTYFVPQIISDSPAEIVTQKKNKTELKKETKMDSLPALNQEQLPLKGMGLYIGGKGETLKKTYGNPLRIKSTSLGNERWTYGDKEKNYFQVEVSQEDTIVSIFILGSALNIAPFEVGMDITEVYQLATLYPTFSIDYKKDNYTIELSENDLNYHPLVRFENNIYAILMIDRATNKINAVRYIDKQTLLQSDIYEVTPQNESIAEQVPKIDSELMDKENTKEVEITLNALRKRYNVTELRYSKQLSLIADDIFKNRDKIRSETLNEEKKKKDQSLAESSIKIDTSNKNETIKTELDEHENLEQTEQSPLTSEEIQAYFKLNKVDLADGRVVYSNQFVEPTWQITYWFSLENQRTILTNPLMRRFGMAFRGEEVMVILDKEENTTK